MTISVTQKHIDEGVRGNCSYCPIAIAITEATGLHADVGGHEIDWRNVLNEYLYSTPTPTRIREFSDRFDSGLPVEPFSFELEAA